MAKSNFMKTAGFTVSALAILSLLDFLGARFMAPFSPFYKKRETSVPAEPDLPPLDLSKLKISDTKDVLAQRDALRKKPGSKPNTQTLSLDSSKGLSGALSPAALEALALNDAAKTAVPAMTKEQINARIAEITKQLPGLSRDGIDAVMDEIEELETALYALDGRQKPAMPTIKKRTYLGPKKLTEAAQNGDADAQARLGLLYYIGSGVEENEQTAFNWRLKAANQGHADAEYEIGMAYNLGKVVQKDSAASIAWYERSAKGGSSKGQLAYGEALQQGKGTAKNYAAAVRWLEKAAETGNKSQRFSAAFSLCTLYYQGGNQLAQNYEQAFKWAEELSKVDDIGPSYFYLGRHYENGHGVKQDYALAKLNYEKADSLNYGDGQYGLAMMYMDGKGVNLDRDKAITLLKTAKENLSLEATLKLNELGISSE